MRVRVPNITFDGALDYLNKLQCDLQVMVDLQGDMGPRVGKWQTLSETERDRVREDARKAKQSCLTGSTRR